MGQQTLNLKAAGLWLTSNPLDAPPGALANAQNAVIRRPNVVEPRRGQKPDATIPASASADAMANFEGGLILHTSDDKLAIRTNDTTVTPYAGTFAPPTGYPMRFAEAGGGLYATTDAGPVRMDSTSTDPVAAGVPPGLEGNATPTNTAGWVPFNYTVGYRFAWGSRDVDGSLLVGAPSGRILMTNLVQNSFADTFTWARAAAVITVTNVAHGLTTGNTITVNASSDTTALPLGSYVVTVTGVDTFTITGVDAGGTSGTSGNTYAIGGGTRDVSLVTPIPDGITAASPFLLVFRTINTVPSPADPGEDMAQVGEFFPTAAQIAAGAMTVTDIASFANGPSAYFNPNNGGGLADVREQPPLLTDALAFKGYLFGVVEAYRQTFLVSLLGVGGTTGGLRADEGFIITDGTTVEIYVANDIPGNEGGIVTATKTYFYRDNTSTSAAVKIENTMRSLVRVINGRSVMAHATYTSGPSDLPGQAALVSIGVGGTELEAKAYNNAAAWTPTMVMDFDGTPVRVGTTVTVTTALNYHHLVSGQTVNLITGDADFPPGIKTITVTADNMFTYTEAGAAVAGSEFAWKTGAPEAVFNQEATPASWAHSSFEEPDGFPPRFHYQVGGPNTRLDRITSQGEALLYWTSDGLYRLTGDDENSFTLRPMDPTVKLIGTKTPVNMGNKVYALTAQGVVSVSELGVEKISTPLDVALLPYYASTEDMKEATESAAFGVSYESENEYILFLPAPDATPGDPADRAYVYNTQTRTWVGPWLFTWAGISTGAVETAIVGSDNRLYVAAGDRLTRERKDRALSDQQEANGVGIPYDVAYLVQTAGNPGAYKQWVECTEMLEAPQPSAVELYFATEIDTSEEGGTIPSQGNSNVRTYIPLNKSRSARLTVGLRHEAPLEKPTILGLSVVYNVNGTRVGR